MFTVMDSEVRGGVKVPALNIGCAKTSKHLTELRTQVKQSIDHAGKTDCQIIRIVHLQDRISVNEYCFHKH